MAVGATRRAELILDARNVTGECPVWLAREQSLYWVDIPEKKLYCYNTANGQTRHWTAPEMLACLAPGSRANTWIAGAETGLFSLDTSDSSTLGFAPVAQVKHAMPGMRFNDGRCDRQGRFLAGTMATDMRLGATTGCIYALDCDGTVTPLLDGFITPNGMAFSPDGRTMYLSDSHPSVRMVWAYDYDGERGRPSNPRAFVDMADFAGRPDGAAMDTEGCYWICGNDAGLVHRYTPQGQLDFSVALPVSKPSMCAFGGADLRTLYITSIRPQGSLDADVDGGLFAIQFATLQGMAESVCGYRPQTHFQNNEETPCTTP